MLFEKRGYTMDSIHISDWFEDKLYHQVIKVENHGSINDVTHLKLTFYDQYDLHEANLKGKTVNLIYHADFVKDGMINSIVPTSIILVTVRN